MTEDNSGTKLEPRRGKNWVAITAICLALLGALSFGLDIEGAGLCLPDVLPTPVLVVVTLVLSTWGYLRSSAKGGKRMAVFSLSISVILLLASALMPLYSTVARRAPFAIAISNCRQIEMALRAYAADHNGNYPDAALEHPLNSNEAFRKLFIEGYITDEKIFGAEFSPYHPDGKIGQAPDYREALQAGENHWAMTQGLTDGGAADMPVVFEHPAVATWPPKWNADAVEVPKMGRVWRRHRVVVGLNDGSANSMTLESSGGTAVGLAPREGGLPVFPKVRPAPEILNVQK